MEKSNKNKDIIIYGCPYCKEYLPKINSYKYCIYCGKKYNKDKLIIISIMKNIRRNKK